MSTNEQSRHIPSLDGIRALAALWVFGFHAGLPIPGNFGVTIFFFLSGYLITTLLRREWEATGKISLIAFYKRRIRRILPPLYLMLFIGLVIAASGLVRADLSAQVVIAQFFHLTNYTFLMPQPEGVVPHSGVMWSLSIEEHFYLIFPLALILMLRKRLTLNRIAMILAATCVAVLAWRFALVALGASRDYLYQATDARFDSILYGCILALWHNPVYEKAQARFAIPLFVVGLAATAGTFAITGEAKDTIRYSIQGLALLPLFYAAVSFSHWKMFSWLALPAMRWMGTISYTFYLSHMMWLETTRATDSRLLNAAMGFAAAVAFSLVVHFAVERPAHNWHPLRKRAAARIAFRSGEDAKLTVR